MGKAFGPRQHHHEKRGEGRCGIDVVGRAPMHWHVLPDLLDKTQLVKKSYQDRNPAQRRHGTLRLAQNHPLVGQQCDDLTRDWIVRYLWFHSPVVSNSYERQNTELRNSGLTVTIAPTPTTPPRPSRTSRRSMEKCLLNPRCRFADRN